MTPTGRVEGRVLLKGLSGPQSGAEVVLADGEYTLGSGEGDDLQFVDVCLKSGHARIRVDGRSVSVAGGAGSIVNEAGLVIEAGDDEWRELEPLELLQIGSNTFAIGAADSDWAELSETLVENRNAYRKIDKAKRIRSVLRHAAAIVASVLLVCGFAWFAVGFLVGENKTPPMAVAHTIDDVRSALDRFPFGKSIDVRQEVDGEIYAAGYVETLAERRALHEAIEQGGIEANLRIWVLSSIRTQVAAAIDSFGVNVTFDISDEGIATLYGEILSDQQADRFFEYVRVEVSGVSSIVSHVKTANSYFVEVKDLAKRSDIANTILLRLVDDRIEASGVVVRTKVDSWVGFIQSYAKRFADHIALTSYVQVVDDRGTVLVEAPATRLAGPNLPAQSGTVDLDLTRLKQGSLGADDVFRDIDKAPTAGATGSQTADNPTVADDVFRDIDKAPTAGATGSQTADNPTVADAGEAPSEQSVKDETADRVFKGWDERASNSNAGEEKSSDLYLPLILNRIASSDRCWENSQLRIADVPSVLFWLDYLSMSKKISLIAFDKKTQYIILEAALNPDRTQQCAQQFAERQGTRFDKISLYLTEVNRNPLFVHYLVRDFVAPAIDVAGVMLRSQARFIQLRDGDKVQEGSLVSLETRLASVGSLGALLQQEKDVTPVIYTDKLAWKVSAR